MAKKKQDYVDQGYADGVAGVQRAAIAAATWQAGAYDKGYDEGMTAAKTELREHDAERMANTLPTIKVTANTVKILRRVSDGARRAKALTDGIAMRHALTKTAHALSLRRGF